MVTGMANGVTTNTLEPRRNVRKNVKYVIAPFLFYKASAASCWLSFLPQPIIFLIVDTTSYHIERLTVRTPCTILRKIHVNLRNGKEKSSLRMCQLFMALAKFDDRCSRKDSAGTQEHRILSM